MSPTLVAILAYCHAKTSHPIAFSPQALCTEYLRDCVEVKARELWAQGFGWDTAGLMRDCKVEYNAEPYRQKFEE